MLQLPMIIALRILKKHVSLLEFYPLNMSYQRFYFALKRTFFSHRKEYITKQERPNPAKNIPKGEKLIFVYIYFFK